MSSKKNRPFCRPRELFNQETPPDLTLLLRRSAVPDYKIIEESIAMILEVHCDIKTDSAMLLVPSKGSCDLITSKKD